MPALARCTDGLWCEDWYRPEILPTGELISRIRQFKIARGKAMYGHYGTGVVKINGNAMRTGAFADDHMGQPYVLEFGPKQAPTKYALTMRVIG